MDIDPVISDFIGTVPTPDDPGGQDAIFKLFEDAALAAAFGRNGHQIVARLHKETANIHKRADDILKRDRNHTTPAPEVDDAHRLQKRYVAGIHGGKKASRIDKSANGKWTFEFDERGELIRGYMHDEA